MEYTNITFEDLLSNFKTNLAADKHFKNVNSATIFGMYMEMLAASTDMTNFNLQRMLEEAFFKTARNDSSYIKLCRNFGYSPQRPVPAQTQLHIVLKGPFPKEFKDAQNVCIDFTKEIVQLSYLGNPYILEGTYSYKFSESDLAYCTDPTWRKTLRSANVNEKIPYNKLQIVDSSLNNSMPIKCFQGEQKVVEFKGEDVIKEHNTTRLKTNKSSKTHNDEKTYAEQFDNVSQYYDIDDLSFSNWYGHRDPFAKNINNEYAPGNGITKVIIAESAGKAFSDASVSNSRTLFDIEESSIFMHKDIIDSDGNTPSTPIDVCCISTNEDKTVRINFSGLNYLTNDGLKVTTNKDGKPVYQNLYVQYLSTLGAGANKLGVKGSVMSHNNKFYINVNGRFVDITNNIEFVISKDITGGKNFEQKQSMKDNAIASYYNSMMKLVSKRDFINYFSSLTKPINVKTALVYSQANIDNTIEMLDAHPELDVTDALHQLEVRQNTVCYSLAGDLYKSENTYSNEKFYPINILMNPKDFTNNSWPFDFCKYENVDDALTLYCDEYPDHVTDYLKLLISPSGFYTKYKNQEVTTDSAQYEQNIEAVESPIENACTTNTILYSLPPFMQYFDIVGDVKVKPLTKDIDAYKLKMSNKIYKYLNELSTSSREIYKADIIKLYMDDPDTEAANIDIKVSSIVAPSFNSRHFYSNKSVILISNVSVDKNLANVWGFNEIIIPKTDSNYIVIPNSITQNNQITYTLICRKKQSGILNLQNIQSPCTITEFDNYYKIVLKNSYTDSSIPLNDTSVFNPLFTESVDIDNTKKLYEPVANATIINCLVDHLAITTINNENYWSSSKLLADADPSDYGLDNKTLENIKDDLSSWLNKLYVHREADRVIDLPYTIKTYNVTTRDETITRKGNLFTDADKTLSEYSFWNYFATKIIQNFYPNIDEKTSLDSTDWEKATRLLTDIYKLVKPGITDSILDDNNNIVNFSTDMDMAILCNRVNISYKD